MEDIYTLKTPLHPEFESVFTLICDTTQRTNTPFFIAGATARDLVLFNVFGRNPGRQTRDIDTGILVKDWPTYSHVREALLAVGLTESSRAHRLYHLSSGLPIDIIPFGAIADNTSEIQWPPEHLVTMSVAGFQEAHDAALSINIGLENTIKVASLSGLTLLKLIAWDDRGNQNNKDATDFLTILGEYQHLNQDRLWEEYIPAEKLDYDMERQGAFLLGYDVNAILTQPSTNIQTLEKLQSVYAKQELLLISMLRGNLKYDDKRLNLLLSDFWLGVGVNIL